MKRQSKGNSAIPEKRPLVMPGQAPIPWMYPPWSPVQPTYPSLHPPQYWPSAPSQPSWQVAGFTMPDERNTYAVPLTLQAQETRRAIAPDSRERQQLDQRPEVTTQPYIWQPAVNLFEYGSYWLIEVEIPGTDEDSLSITWEDGALLVEGDVSAEDQEYSYHWERRTGAFARRIFIPEEVDADRAEAAYRQGILEILIHKPKE